MSDQSPIHQIIGTHCTYGSSAINPRKGDLENRPMGYSARASSLEGNQLRTQYQTVERYFNYNLPKDATTDQRDSLTAETAPRKFVYVPKSGAYRFIGMVHYRQKDTADRPGSYFGHMLVQKRPKNDEASWNLDEIVAMFEYPEWIRSEEELKGRENLKALPALPETKNSTSFLSVLKSLLSQSTEKINQNKEIHRYVPQRWREMPASQRVELLKGVLAAALNACDDPKKSLIIAVEPEMAALLLSVVQLLVPSSLLGESSFSTFETDYERRLPVDFAVTSPLNASTDFEFTPEVKRRQVAFNTFDTSQSLPSNAYSDFVIPKLKSSKSLVT